MARQRFIWPDIWTDPAFGRMSPIAQVLYIGLFSNADDEGRISADPAFLRATIFPHQKLSDRKTNAVRAEVVKSMKKLVLYEVDGREILCFTNWHEWQKPKYPKPSKLPCPPTIPASSSGNPSGKPSHNDSGKDSPTTSGSDSPVGWVGLGRDETKAVTPTTDAAPASANSNGLGSELFEDDIDFDHILRDIK